MSLSVYNIQGEKTGEVQVAAELLEHDVSRSLLHRVVVSYEANLRQGSANTKTRGERRGSGKKLWKQKGTGRARMGSIRSPLWRKGGVSFGPKPRDYRMRMSKKERLQALHGALAGKIKDSQVMVLDSMAIAEPKTRIVSNFMKKTGIDKSVLFVSSAILPTWLQASRNIPKLASYPLSDLNALEVLKARTIVVEKAAFDRMIGEGKA